MPRSLRTRSPHFAPRTSHAFPRVADPVTQATTLDRAAGSRPIGGNAVTLLVDGTEAYPAMLELIAKAERWIHFENYIIRDDATGRRFAEALSARARLGVHVRVLADWFGSLGTSNSYWRALREAGAEVRLFRPLDLLDPLANVSRDHRKLVVADGAAAIIGGLCIGDEWAGATDNSTLLQSIVTRFGDKIIFSTFTFHSRRYGE